MPTIGKIKVNLEGDTRRFDQAMRRSGRQVDRLSRRFQAFRATLVPLAGALGFGALIRSTVNEAVRMQQLSDRLGTTAQAFSRLARVGERAGIRLDAMGTIVQRLQRRAQEAIEGNKDLANIFQRLGINLDTFIKLDAVEAFTQFGEALSKVKTQAEKLFIAVRILDTEGAQALQLNLADLRRTLANTTGITNEQAASVTRLAAAWETLGEKTRSFSLSFADYIGFTRVLEIFTSGAILDIGGAVGQGYLRSLEQRFRDSPLRQFLFPTPELRQFAPLTGQIGRGPSTTFTNVPSVGPPGRPGPFQGGDFGLSNRILEQLRAIRSNTLKKGAVLE